MVSICEYVIYSFKSEGQIIINMPLSGRLRYINSACSSDRETTTDCTCSADMVVCTSGGTMQRALETLKLVVHVIRQPLNVNDGVCSTAAVSLGFTVGEGVRIAAKESYPPFVPCLHSSTITRICKTWGDPIV